jgi:hypothetical protein
VIFLSTISLITSLAASEVAAPTANATAARPASPTVWGLPSIKLPKLRLPRLRKPASSSATMSLVEARLKALVGDEEGYYADHGHYGAQTSQLPQTMKVDRKRFDEVDVQMLYAGKRGWSAMASHPSAPGRTCVIYVGFRNNLPMIPRTRADGLDAKQEGQAACDK